MDVIVTPAEGGTVWQLTDLLGRSMGRITASAPRQFMIHPEGHASETMAGIQQGPHASLDAALAEIERHTRGVCRRNPVRRSALDSAQQSRSSAEYPIFTAGRSICFTANARPDCLMTGPSVPVEGIVDFRARTERMWAPADVTADHCVAVFAEIFWRLGSTQP